MMVNNFDQTEIENLVGDKIYELGVSKKVFPNRPSSSTDNLADFVVCKVTGSIDDLAARGECTLSIHLFAKDVDHVKNGKKLSVMQRRLREGLPARIGDIVLNLNSFKPIGDAQDGTGYHVRIISIKTFIKPTM